MQHANPLKYGIGVIISCRLVNQAGAVYPAPYPKTSMQQKFFFKHPIAHADLLSYTEATALLNVSHASIVNWIKAGYLEKSEYKGYLKKQSFEKFCQDIVGHEKLIARANKQHAQMHDHAPLAAEIFNKVWHNPADKNHGDRLAQAYEDVLSNTYKNKQGVYYTPMALCRDLIAKADLNQKTRFCDPCCGSGNFLIAALEAGVSPRHLTGYEVDTVALEIARRRLFDRSGYKGENLRVADFLSLTDAARYDVLITNPPWGKKYFKNQRQVLSKRFGLQQSFDSCALFTMAMLKSVQENGKIGLLLPESFFNVKSFHEIRNIVLAQNIAWLIDFGKAFEGLVTKASAIVFSKKVAAFGNKINCLSGEKSTAHRQTTFANNPFSIINFDIRETEADALALMLKQPHTTLKDKARWGLGIVTGNNKKHLVEHPQAGFVPVFKGADIGKGRIKKPTHYLQPDFSLYQQVAPLTLYQAPCKIIYRFISSDLVFFCDEQQRFILNSANMLIIDEQRLVKTRKLVEYFNLDVINWLHKKLFNTHKILRSHLECIPIYLDYLNNIKQPSNPSLLAYLGLEAIDGTYRAGKMPADNLRSPQPTLA